MKKATRETRSKATETRTSAKAVKSKAVKSRAVKSKTVKSKTVKARAVKARAVKSRAVKARAARAAVTVAGIALSADGATWRIVLSDARRVRMSAAAGLALKIAIGTRWTDALAERIGRFNREQQLFAKAMSLVAARPGIDRATLVRHLGGDADARRAASAVARNGWLA